MTSLTTGLILLRGGRVYTPAAPDATAMVVRGDTVEWVGTDSAAQVAYGDAADQVIDLDGALVTPAFVDAHVHLTSTGLALSGLDLAGCRSLAEALDRLARHAREHPGEVICGQGWDETDWPEGRPPTRAEIDAAAGDALVYLSRVDVHSAVVSSALLAAAPGIQQADGYTEDGWLRREAHHIARRVARDAITPGQRRVLQRAALRRAAELGIGALHECGGPEISGEDDFTDLLRLAVEEPGPEVYGLWGELGAVDKAERLGAHAVAGDLCCDGAIGSRTAYLREPYADAPDTRGARYLTAGDVAEHLVACTRAGVQAGFHAIGDAALDAVVEGFAKAAQVVGEAALVAARHRVEHAEMADTDLIAAFARYGVIASVQPAFDAAWGGPDGMYARRLGAERALVMNPFAALAAAGVPLAFGSDAPVTPLDPWGAIRAAVYHHNPDQRISARAAFTAHTRGGWRALGRDTEGVLRPGAPATYAIWQVGELVVQVPDERIQAWSTDPRSRVPGLPDLSPGVAPPRCLRTVVRGRIVYTREGALE
ncbi:amidohydrolase [Carbonactinospora thermoautotrophica]|uniref:amidohydrolase n=1 Tax=Carbonactinospora thermoautotrophica TaxID=1469144 RepID=UPI00226F2A33|nr:amidohydrolase [Carbonactinospora thermoautotrophica]MCX9192178.1 amidohydrolase [Carbonactinospora thermoautotrophica]